MRVVAGKYRGFQLEGPKGSNTRPTDNKIKEAIFDMLYPIKTDSTALDLFSGSGQMGIEFLSRDLDFVYLNEIDRNTFKILEKNLSKLDTNNFKVSKSDFKIALLNYKNKGVKFDYIFLDPPYNTDFLAESIKLIMDYELVNEDGIVITESDKDLKFDDDYDLYLIKEKTYGRKYVNIYLK